MGTSVFMSKRKNYVVFLNISFVIALFAFTISYFYSQEFLVLNSTQIFKSSSKQGCNGLHALDDYKAKCFYLKSKNNPCVKQGYIDYLYLFYCKFGTFTLLGYSLLFLWLLVLFYILGNTASEYFCSSLESLSGFFKLSPTIAGVTLLSLGNGAPDVFSSLVSFMGGGTCEIGLNTVLGGASFVSCVVVGVMSISVRRRCVRVNKSDLVRDIFFLLLALLCLTVILVQKEIDLWGALSFFSIYIAYVIVVYVLHIRSKNVGKDSEIGADLSHHGNDLTIPILQNMEKGELNSVEEVDEVGQVKRRWFCLGSSRYSSASCGVFLSILEMPLYLPRRLTIPVVSEERWSKGYAVASVSLAPLLLSTLGSSQIENSKTLSLVIYGVGLLFGIGFGVVSYLTTEKSSPPKSCIFPWLAGGFLMSVTWSYITAQELVGLLVSLAHMFGVNPSILGLTVLAWGNSVGDLVTNLTMALNGGAEGAQIAFAGCYAGPIFNTLFGLGLSLVWYCWSKYPSFVAIPRDPYLFQTLGFLAAALLWSLLILPRRDMKLEGAFGGGLLVIYIVSISWSVIQALGSSQLDAY
ncbi:Sodium/calcium exchanger membrane region [Parasponia andersonii]|uniref:Sodium/calcium exchanger membrane region n=1 Tax=Parasponia andersonii TaxID=3476 RepID=A0A2P5ANV0_PARAD|nr:Sodium/calcium exchanger membrane region [Parasponia andersonii]